jgi:ABC-type multidrug transport system fused ATPase/permease subunit
MAKQDFEKINELCLYLLLLVVVSAAGGSIRSVIFNSMSERIARNLRKDFYESMVNKDVAFFDDQKAGDLLSRLNSDVQVIQDALSENVSMLLRGSV